MSSGVPQGSVSGPLLFLIFVNDLTEQISSECRLFADDALRYNTRDISHVLREDPSKLNNWSKVWQLKFKIDKCAVLSVKDLKQHQAKDNVTKDLEMLITIHISSFELSYKSD